MIPYVITNSDQTPEFAPIHKSGHDGGDFIFVPINKVSKKSESISSLQDLSKEELNKIKYFFTHYKAL